MMSFPGVTPRKLLALALLVLAIVGIAASSLIAVGQTTGPGDDPRFEPVPVLVVPDSAQSIVATVFFNSPTDVELVDGVTSNWLAPARVGGPPLIKVEVFDDAGGLLEAFNQWHPLWVENYGDDGAARSWKAESRRCTRTLSGPIWLLSTSSKSRRK